MYGSKTKLQCLTPKTYDNFVAVSVNYEITHKTGFGPWDSGKTCGGYWISLQGEKGMTGIHYCVADRGNSVTSCTFTDPVSIGTVTHMIVMHECVDKIGFQWAKVAVNGWNIAKWSGNETVALYQTKFIALTPIGLRTFTSSLMLKSGVNVYPTMSIKCMLGRLDKNSELKNVRPTGQRSFQPVDYYVVQFLEYLPHTFILA